ncbi:MAG: serine/threonine-protein kinase [Cyanobacteria bacterium P01_D01_bin.156]
MVYCLNCDYDQNPASYRYCQQCGKPLALRGRFIILRQIGEGGFGKTYLAEDLDNRQKPCVVKQLVYQGQSAYAEQEAQRLFEQEAERLDQLSDHPQIPQLLAYFEDGRYLYLVQEFIEGYDLQHELMQQGAFSEAKIWEFLQELLPILRFVHEHNVIHRDLKLENIMRSDRKLILIDFGVAKFLAETNCQGGTVVGTPGYAPPEQMQGRVSPASDLFSLGIICFHLLTQQNIYQLFQDHNYTWVNQWQQYLQQPISQKLMRILDRLLTLDERERYITADAVLYDINQNALTAESSPSGMSPFAQTIAPPEKTTIQKGSRLSLSANKLFISLAMVGVVGAGLWVFFRPSTPVVEPPVRPVTTTTESDAVSFAQVTQVPEGIFNYGGSTTWAPIRGSVDLEIQTARPEFRLQYIPPDDKEPSSQAGLEMLVEGKVAFSLASRLPSNALMEDLKAQGVQMRLVPVAESFDVVAVHPDLPISQLTTDQLNAILEGTVSNWRQIEGPDLPIIRLDREVNEDFEDTRPNFDGDNIETFLTPSEGISRLAMTPGGVYIHTAAVLVPQCAVKVLSLVNAAGQVVVPYREPAVPISQCPTQRNKLNLEELGSGKYPRQLSDTLYVVINQNGGLEQQAGEAYANFLLSFEGQTLLEKAGYLGIRK